MPNVSPVYKDVLEDPAHAEHPFYETKERTINEYFAESLKYASTSGNELLEGINPFAGIRARPDCSRPGDSAGGHRSPARG